MNKKLFALYFLTFIIVTTMVGCGKEENVSANSGDIFESNSIIVDNNEVKVEENLEGATENPEITGSEMSENVDNTKEIESETQYKVYKAMTHTPTIKILEPSNISNYDMDFKNHNRDDYDFYCIAVSAVYDTNDDKLLHNKPVLTGVEEGMYAVSKHTTWLTSEDKEQLEVSESATCRVLYYIEYAIKKGETPENIKLVEINDKEIIDITNAKSDVEIIESGDASLWDTLKIADEYGTEHYIIPISSSNYYNTTGTEAKDLSTPGYAYSFYEFDILQVGDCKDVPTDVKKVEEFYWNWEKLGLSLSYNNLKYVESKSEERNNVIKIDEDDKVYKIKRDNGFTDLTVQMYTNEIPNEEFLNNNTLKIQIDDITLSMNINWNM